MSAKQEHSIRLPIKDINLYKRTERIIRKRIEFKWKGDQTWLGLTKEDLTELTIQIAVFIGITPDQARKIRIIFGDHYQVSERSEPLSGVCRSVYYVNRWKYTSHTVVINRSLEVALSNIQMYNAEKAEDDQKIQNLGLLGTSSELCDLLLEGIEEPISTIAEELSHAHVKALAGSKIVLEIWRSRYIEILKTKGLITDELYDTDLLEIAAHRVKLRVLTYFSEGERREYFRKLYHESLFQNRIHPSVIYESSFIPTGFRRP